MPDRLVFVPLGGVGEIGMNVYLYGLDDAWLMVDLGISFADERLPGADIVLPDIQFAEELGDKLKALILTHAHEDHLGAVPYLWRRLRVPVWCSDFTGAVLRLKLAAHGLAAEVPIKRVKPREPFKIGPFACRFLHVTHSIPESGALLLESPRRPRPPRRGLETRPRGAGRRGQRRRGAGAYRQAGRARDGVRQHQ